MGQELPFAVPRAYARPAHRQGWLEIGRTASLQSVTSPTNRSEIIAELESNADSIAVFFSALPDATLFVGDPDHWGPAHHLVHLTRTSIAITRGLCSGDRRIHPTGHSRTYAEMIASATAGLGSASKERLLEMGRVVVVEPGASGTGLASEFLAASAELRASVAQWSEDDLDRHALRHPLIGVLTVREMLLFCILHERHHVRLVQARLEADSSR